MMLPHIYIITGPGSPFDLRCGTGFATRDLAEKFVSELDPHQQEEACIIEMRISYGKPSYIQQMGRAERVGAEVHKKLEDYAETGIMPDFSPVSKAELERVQEEGQTALFEVNAAKMVPRTGIAVDCGSVSGKNPGLFKYRLVDISNKNVLEEIQIKGDTTNNIAEFLALCHGLAYVIDNNLQLDVYSDSKTALAWLRDRRMKTKHVVTHTQQKEMISAALILARLLPRERRPKFWITELWGDIAADYGQKTPRLPKQ